MKISIITPSFNQADYIDQTIKSVLSQRGDFKVEMIVVDGGSNDGTIEILKRYGSDIVWVSEKDKGQADAINKGIELCTGDIIGWLNSDDIYLENSFQKISSFFNSNVKCEWLFGKCKIIDVKNDEIRSFITKYKNYYLSKYSYKRLLIENFISQPAVFFRKSLFNKVGCLNIHFNYAMDYDLWLRFGKQADPYFINDYLSAFRIHTDSKGEQNYKHQFKEEYKIATVYTQSKIIKLFHWLNIWKIILAYKLIK
ncbi:MAG: glycosyltransferase [Bacteroidetes bacterium HGW-Bacteroidetes-17]|jgi:glycosyltransferase involved in cell wall biosynthesis|nr:MAG: glycosyltransferase [Bacteroidetes bacterium HGW-Bacteroidetes-17]